MLQLVHVHCLSRMWHRVCSKRRGSSGPAASTVIRADGRRHWRAAGAVRQQSGCRCRPERWATAGQAICKQPAAAATVVSMHSELTADGCVRCLSADGWRVVVRATLAGNGAAGDDAPSNRLLLMQHWGPGSCAALVQASAEPYTHLNLSGGITPGSRQRWHCSTRSTALPVTLSRERGRHVTDSSPAEHWWAANLTTCYCSDCESPRLSPPGGDTGRQGRGTGAPDRPRVAAGCG